MDLAEAVEFNSSAARANIQAVRPGIRVFELSTKFREGMRDYFDFLAASLTQMRTPLSQTV
jgi:hydrogenase nickel incorporation protein HypB